MVALLFRSKPIKSPVTSRLRSSSDAGFAGRPRWRDVIGSARQNTGNMVGLESMSRYVSPVNPAIYPHLTLVLMSIGVFFTAWFFVYEVTSTKLTRDFFKECLIALVASVFMGFGILFLLLWVGIYV
uniref:Dolichyl-diphosphooligosaccharide-protein glycosyltransferase subunit TMEM258 n=1 Tax=Scylla olivacea TaxID=85551 RepID=A0A0N7Z9Q9_SCYOL